MELDLEECMIAALMHPWSFAPDRGEIEARPLFESLGWKNDFPQDLESWNQWLGTDASLFRQSLAQHLGGQTEMFECELRMPQASGEFKWHLMRGSLRHQGARRILMGFVWDLHERKTKEEKLQLLATLDGSSGTLNRRTGLLLAERLRLFSKKNMEPFCLMLFEIQNLKALNEKNGTTAGDQMIQSFVQLMKKEMGPQDVLWRHEGASFCLVKAKMSAVELEKSFQGLDPKIQDLNTRQGKEFPLVIKWGLAEDGVQADGLDALVHRARLDLQSRSRLTRV